MKTLLYNGIVIVDGEVIYDRAHVLIDGDRIVDTFQKNNQKLEFVMQDKEVQVIDVKGHYVMPGMIDVHLHGAVGHDFVCPSQMCLDEVSKNIVKDGVTGFLASLTPLNFDGFLKVLHQYTTLSQTSEAATCLGIHMEGPFLSKKYKAVMVEENLKIPSIEEFKQFQLASKNQIKMMTIAPELEGSNEVIEYGSQHGVRMMLGHSAASSRVAREGLHHGAFGFTHLYNAMSQHLHRDPGMVSAAFIERDAYVELIADGFHVDPEAVLMTYRNKGAKSIILVTDAMLGKGMPNGEFVFSELPCYKDGNSVTVIETGRRAGSVVGLDFIIRKMREITKCDVRELVQMACVNPSILAQVNTEKGTLEIGKIADVCVMNERLENQMTFVNGLLVYSN